METTARPADLGPFAPERGRPSRAASAGLLLGAAAAAVAALGLVVDAAGETSFHSRSLAIPLGGLAIISGIAGLYAVSVAGLRGRRAAVLGSAVGGAAAVVSFLHGAVQDGSLQLGDFALAYFDRDVIAAVWGDLLKALGNTVKLAALSEAIGIGVGLVLATFALSSKWWLRMPAVVYIDVIRGLPLLMLFLLLYFGLTYVGVTLDVFVASILGLSINSSAYVAEIWRAGIQSVERGQMDAARSLGMPHATAMLFVVIPQAARRVIPPLTNEFIALVKDTSLVSILGSTVASRELLQTARQSVATTFSATPFMAASILYLAVTLPLIRLVTRLERRLMPGAMPIRVRVLRRTGGLRGA